MATPIIPVLIHGECSALTFDKTKPQQLPQFFKDLECLFTHTNMTNEDDKKHQIM